MTTREQALAAELERIKESQNKTLEGILKTRGDRLSDPDGFTRVKDRQEAYREGFEFGAIWGATWEAQRSAVLLEALEFYANYMSGDNPQFTKNGMQKYPDPRIARAALEKYRGKQ